MRRWRKDTVSVRACGVRICDEGCPKFKEVIHKGYRYVVVYNGRVTLFEKGTCSALAPFLGGIGVVCKKGHKGVCNCVPLCGQVFDYFIGYVIWALDYKRT
jgi:hypothetical protein